MSSPNCCCIIAPGELCVPLQKAWYYEPQFSSVADEAWQYVRIQQMNPAAPLKPVFDGLFEAVNGVHRFWDILGGSTLSTRIVAEIADPRYDIVDMRLKYIQWDQFRPIPFMQFDLSYKRFNIEFGTEVIEHIVRWEIPLEQNHDPRETLLFEAGDVIAETKDGVWNYSSAVITWNTSERQPNELPSLLSNQWVDNGPPLVARGGDFVELQEDGYYVAPVQLKALTWYRLEITACVFNIQEPIPFADPHPIWGVVVQDLEDIDRLASPVSLGHDTRGFPIARVTYEFQVPAAGQYYVGAVLRRRFYVHINNIWLEEM